MKISNFQIVNSERIDLPAGLTHTHERGIVVARTHTTGENEIQFRSILFVCENRKKKKLFRQIFELSVRFSRLFRSKLGESFCERLLCDDFGEPSTTSRARNHSKYNLEIFTFCVEFFMRPVYAPFVELDEFFRFFLFLRLHFKHLRI